MKSVEDKTGYFQISNPRKNQKCHGGQNIENVSIIKCQNRKMSELEIVTFGKVSIVLPPNF